MGKMQLPLDFREFLHLLNSHNVEYLVVGGYAVGHHGFPRATGDLDIWIAVNETNASATVTALKEFGFNVPALTKELFLEEGRITQMGVPPVRIEILTKISGVRFDQCYVNRVVSETEGLKLNVIGLNDLKKNKKAAGRLKDLNDLENLV
ncbi:MAG TPA: hypothetical protein VK615_07200 [Candidatus Binatia bacterium]|nr:hypothetical protein [Candidatus Binatia bacterium]